MLDHTVATTDFTTFYEAWQPKVATAVAQQGFRGEEAADLQQDIFLFFHKGGYLAKFDETKARFTTFIWGHIKFQIKDRKRKLWVRGQREVVTDLTDPIHDKASVDPGLAQTEFAVAVTAIHESLKGLPATETKNMSRLFRDIVKLIHTTGSFSQTELAKMRGVSRQAISQQVADLATLPELQAWRETLAS